MQIERLQTELEKAQNDLHGLGESLTAQKGQEEQTLAQLHTLQMECVQLNETTKAKQSEIDTKVAELQALSQLLEQTRLAKLEQEAG